MTSDGNEFRGDSAMQLLLALIGVRSDRERDERLRGLTAGADWDRVAQAAEDHRVIPLLCRGVRPTCAEAVPKDVLSRLEAAYASNARRNLLLALELVRLLDVLEKSGIAAMAFRGPAVAVGVYGDLALRRFTDLDILVPPADVPAACRALEADGLAPEFRFDDAREPALIRFRGALAFMPPDRCLNVDLHWRLHQEFGALDSELHGIRARADTVTIEGRPVRTLCRDDLLVHFCLHGALHAWERLSYVCDVAELVGGQPEFDWRRQLPEWRRQKRTRAVFLGLVLARRLLGAPVPDGVLDAARSDPRVEALAERVARRLCGPYTERAPRSERWPFQAAMLESPRDKMRFLAGLTVVPTGPDIAAVRLPRPLFFLYYLIRPVRLAGKALSRPFRCPPAS